MVINENISYIIGLYQTDGNLYKNKKSNKGKSSIEISEKDIDILEKIQKIIPYKSNIIKRKRIIKLKNKDYHFYSVNFYVCNVEFRNFLYDNGVPYGKKSKIIKPPKNIKKIDYIRGLIDGDGSLGFTKDNIPFVGFVTESEYIKDYLCNFIQDITGKNIKIINKNKRDNIYNLIITKEDAVIFCEKIYYKKSLSLNRKYEISQNIIKWKRPDNMIKVTWEKRKWTKYEDDYIMNHLLDESIEKLKRTKNSILTRKCRIKNNFTY